MRPTCNRHPEGVGRDPTAEIVPERTQGDEASVKDNLLLKAGVSEQLVG